MVSVGHQWGRLPSNRQHRHVINRLPTTKNTARVAFSQYTPRQIPCSPLCGNYTKLYESVELSKLDNPSMAVPCEVWPLRRLAEAGRATVCLNVSLVWWARVCSSGSVRDRILQIPIPLCPCSLDYFMHFLPNQYYQAHLVWIHQFINSDLTEVGIGTGWSRQGPGNEGCRLTATGTHGVGNNKAMPEDIDT